MPRPCPLAITGSCSCSAVARAAASAPPIQTSDPSTSTGRSAAASSPAIWRTAAGSGPARGGGRGGRQPGLGLVVQRLQGYVEEDRPAVGGGRQPERLVHRPGQLRGGVLGPGALGHRGQDRRLVDLLQAARTPPVVGGAAAEHDDRCAVEVRRRYRADAVGHAGPGGHHGEARGPGQPGRGLRREDSGLLMPDVDQPDRRPGRPRMHRRVVQREHVAAGQREHGRDAVPPGRPERQRPAVPGQNL